MKDIDSPTCTAFAGSRRIASGPVREVALAAKAVIDRDATIAILIFDDRTSRPVEVDFRGTAEDVLRRLAPDGDAPQRPADPEPAAAPSRGPGRPKLGVVAREVTLLPRHWDWLAQQAGGASVALRKLVEQARRAHGERDQIRQAQESSYRFMAAMAGNQPGFEEATRALFAGDRDRFAVLIASWPADIRDHAMCLAAAAWVLQPGRSAAG